MERTEQGSGPEESIRLAGARHPHTHRFGAQAMGETELKK